LVDAIDGILATFVSQIAKLRVAQPIPFVGIWVFHFRGLVDTFLYTPNGMSRPEIDGVWFAVSAKLSALTVPIPKCVDNILGEIVKQY
jgi:hypothetical protein